MGSANVFLLRGGGGFDFKNNALPHQIIEILCPLFVPDLLLIEQST